ncbi:collagen-binding protein [marine bacterium AO1-C]|nr:collagen-binding protein [marine bacterium AO1-C]
MHQSRLFLFLILLLSWAYGINAQTSAPLKQTITIKPGTQTIGQVLEEIEKQTQLKFSYNNAILDIQQTVRLQATRLTVETALDQILSPLNLRYILRGKLLIIQKDTDQTSPPKPSAFTISGTVKSESDGEVLIGATVYIAALNKGVYTNAYGFYSLTLPPGKYQLQSSYIGFQNRHQAIDLATNRILNIELANDTTELKEVVVTDNLFDDELSRSEMSLDVLNGEQVKNTPAFLGEADVIQSLLTLPGVSNVGELSGGFNVRGGNVDQNLILMDEAPVYNSTHLLGFFSVFNPLSVKDVKLYKGAIPAKYGGRLSSVLDIRHKDGSLKRFNGEGEAGLVSVKLSLEVPLIKDRSSLLVAGRRTFADLMFKLSDDEVVRNNRFFFYDFNTKFNYKINDKNRLYISGYFGRDVVGLNNLINFSWGNATTTVRWNHIYNSKLFSNTSLIFSDYNYSLKIPDPTGVLDWRAGITNYQFKNDFTWFINPGNTLDFGVNGIYYDFQPGNVVFSGNTSINIFSVAKEKALEAALYVNHVLELGEKISLNYGLRYTHFFKLGPQEVRLYQPNQPRNNETITGFRTFGNNQLIVDYYGLEPRFGLTWKASKNQVVRFNYSRNRQYIHLISNTTVRIPTDIWKASGTHIKPMTSDQVTLGYFIDFAKKRYFFSAEAYYKRIVDLLEYKSGSDLLLNEFPETELIQGDGRAYGLELSLKKNKGRLNGWINYTLARTERRVNGRFPEERINNGNYYPADYDKTHSLKVLFNYRLRKRLIFSANFIYSTGRPFSLPSSKYRFGSDVLVQYSERNQRRLDDYHRLDVSLRLVGKGKKRWKGEWVFSVYNVYARRNTFNIFFETNDEMESTATKLSILATMFPSVAYRFKF